MSLASMAAPTGASETTRRPGAARWLAVLGIVLGAGLLAGFYGINEYAGGTGAVVRTANNNHARFEAIFRDLAQARHRALDLGLEILLRQRPLVEAFARDDRPGLMAQAEPLFAVLQKDHDILQLNFWRAPARLFYWAGRPAMQDVDLSSFRKSIIAANERRQRIATVESGLGGLIAFRVMVPVLFDDRMAGLIEFSSNFDQPLERASETTGLKWAYSLTREEAERVQRPADAKTDGWQGDDVFFRYGDAATMQTLRAIRFDPRSGQHSLTQAGGRTIYVRSFPVTNFSGQPITMVATLLDVTEPFAEVFRVVAVKAAILFLLVAVAGSIGFLKFGQIKAQFAGAVGRQRRELEERAAAFEAAQAQLKQVDLIKRGFFANLVAAVNGPLQAVAGQLGGVAPALRGTDAEGRLQFAIDETSRLSRLVEDYQQLELFRQKLVGSDAPEASLAAVAARALEEDLAGYRRLPQLTITAAVPAELPPTRGDADLLRRAVAGLAGYAAQRSGRGRITITGRQDEARWLALSITGSAFTGPGAPSDALLDEARQFLNRMADNGNGADAGGPLVGVVLARVIIEACGGSLVALPAGEAPGFVIRLPAAA